MPTADPDGRVEHGDDENPTSDYAKVATSVARGGLWSAGGQIAGLVVGLVATPFTIRILGPACYGIWSLLQTVLSWVGLADFGMSSTSTKFAGDALARNDDNGEVEAVWAAAVITVIATIAVAGVTAIAASPIVRDVLSIHGGLAGPAILGLRILCVAQVAAVIATTFNTSQQIRLKWRSFTIITVGTAVLQIILVPVVLHFFGGGVPAACGVALSMSLLSAIGTMIIAHRLQPGLARIRLSGPTTRLMLRFGAALTVNGLASIPLTSAERLLLAHYSSPRQVSYYVVASRLAMLLAAVPQAVAAPLFPALVALEGSGAVAAARRLYHDALVGVFMVLTPAAVLLGFIAKPFLGTWAGAIYAEHSTTLFFVIVAGVWFNVLAYMPTTYMIATGRAAILARVRMLELVPYLIAAAVLTANFGAIGAAAVWAGRAVVDAVVFFVIAKRASGMPISPLSEHGLRSLLAPAVLALIAVVLAPALHGLLARALVAVILSASYGALLWVAVLTASERAIVSKLRGRLTRSV